MFSFVACLVLLTTSVVSLPNITRPSPTLTVRQAAIPPFDDCNSTCASYTALKKARRVSHFQCNTTFLETQGKCLVCRAATSQEAGWVQILLNAEQNQCIEDGIVIDFKVRLSLPPDAQDIVDVYSHQSDVLRQHQTAYLTLQIFGGHVGFVIVLVLATFSHNSQRHPTFFNFCMSWIFSSIVFSMSLYRGTKYNTIVNPLSRVPSNMCLAQAALTNGAQVMTACSTMALVIQLWIGLRTSIHGNALHGPRRQWLTIMLLASPYILFLAFSIPSIFLGMLWVTWSVGMEGTSLKQFLPANFYCTIVDIEPFLRFSYAVVLGQLLVAALFDVLIIIMLYRYWKAFRHIQEDSTLSLSTIIRVMIFSIYRVIVAIAYAAVLCMPQLNQTPPIVRAEAQSLGAVLFLSNFPVWVDMLEATIPLVGSLVFGINNDVLARLMFWLRKHRASSGDQ